MLALKLLLLLTSARWLSASMPKDDYATFSIDSTSTADVTVGSRVRRARLDFDTSGVSLLDCTRGAHSENFVFSEDSITNPVQMAHYTVRVNTTCAAAADSSAEITIGLQTSTSPLWKIWSYASFTKDEIRVGRMHPKNKYTLRKRQTSQRALQCAGGPSERMCLLRDVRIREHPGQRFVVDFQSTSEKITVPQHVFLHYTSTSNCHSAATIAAWPPLQLLAPAGTLSIRAELLVVSEENYGAEYGSDACEYLSNLLRASGRLVAHDDPELVLLGNTVLHDYVFDRDYIQNTLHTRIVMTRDYFSLLETLLFMFVFVVYIYLKTDPTERIGAYLVGVMPACAVCKQPIVSICARHYIKKAVVAHYVSIAAVYAIAWYAVGVASRIGVGYDELELSIWAYVSLGVASAEYAVYVAVQLFYYRRQRRMLIGDVQNWELLGVASAKSACSVAIFALTSVVRADEFSSALSFCVALFIVYDGLRRFIEEFIMLLRAPQWWWGTRFLVVGTALGAGFTVYVMSKHVLYATLGDSKIFTAIFVMIAAYFALLLNLTCMRRAMLQQLRTQLQTEK
jgi:NADH:ubiquinone oxidoreductase subunit K